MPELGAVSWIMPPRLAMSASLFTQNWTILALSPPLQEQIAIVTAPITRTIRPFDASNLMVTRVQIGECLEARRASCGAEECDPDGVILRRIRTIAFADD